MTGHRSLQMSLPTGQQGSSGLNVSSSTLQVDAKFALKMASPAVTPPRGTSPERLVATLSRTNSAELLVRRWGTSRGDAQSPNFEVYPVLDIHGGPAILGNHELHRAILVSHSRRDPAALNLTYAVVDGLRTGMDPETGQPFSKHCHKDSRRVELWLDKEQLSQSGGDDWTEPILRAMRDGVVTVFCLGNAFCGSKECRTEVQYAVRKGFAAIPVFLEWPCKDESAFEQWKSTSCRKHVPGGGESLLDVDVRQFREWQAKADVVDFRLGQLQGIPGDFFSLGSFVCQHCRGTKDSRCRSDDGRSRCSEWSTASAGEAGPKLIQAVRALGKYIDAHVQKNLQEIASPPPNFPPKPIPPEDADPDSEPEPEPESGLSPPPSEVGTTVELRFDGAIDADIAPAVLDEVQIAVMDALWIEIEQLEVSFPPPSVSSETLNSSRADRLSVSVEVLPSWFDDFGGADEAGSQHLSDASGPLKDQITEMLRASIEDAVINVQIVSGSIRVIISGLPRWAAMVLASVVLGGATRELSTADLRRRVCAILHEHVDRLDYQKVPDVFVDGERQILPQAPQSEQEPEREPEPEPERQRDLGAWHPMEPEPEAGLTRSAEEELRAGAEAMWDGADEWWWCDGDRRDQPVPYSADFSRKLSAETTAHSGSSALGAFLGVNLCSPRVRTPCERWEVGCDKQGQWWQFVVAEPSRSRPVLREPHKTPTVADAAAWLAVTAGDAERLREALQNGQVDPDFRGPVHSRDTLLHAAVRSGAMSCVRVLCEPKHRADMNARNVYRETPMDLLRAATGKDPGGCMAVMKELSTLGQADGEQFSKIRPAVFFHRAGPMHSAAPPSRANPAAEKIGWKIRWTPPFTRTARTGIVYARHAAIKGGLLAWDKELFCPIGCHMVAVLGLKRIYTDGQAEMFDDEATWSDQSTPTRCVMERVAVNFSDVAFEACRPATAAEMDLAIQQLSEEELSFWQQHQQPQHLLTDQANLTLASELCDRVRVIEFNHSHSRPDAAGTQPERQSEQLIVAAGLATAALPSGVSPDCKMCTQMCVGALSLQPPADDADPSLCNCATTKQHTDAVRAQAAHETWSLDEPDPSRLQLRLQLGFRNPVHPGVRYSRGNDLFEPVRRRLEAACKDKTTGRKYKVSELPNEALEACAAKLDLTSAPFAPHLCSSCVRCHEQAHRDASQAERLAIQKREARGLLCQGKEKMELASSKEPRSTDQRQLFEEAARCFSRALKSGTGKFFNGDVTLFAAELWDLREDSLWSQCTAWDLHNWLAVAQIQIHICENDFASAAAILDKKREFDRLGHTLDATGGEGLEAAWSSVHRSMQAMMDALFAGKHEGVRRHENQTATAVSTWQKVLRDISHSANKLTMQGFEELPSEDGRERTHDALRLAEMAFKTSAHLMRTMRREPALHNSLSSFRTAVRLCRHAEKIRRTPREAREETAGGAFDCHYTANHPVYRGYRAGAVCWAYAMARKAVEQSSIETHCGMKDIHPDEMLQLQSSMSRLRLWLDNCIKLARDELKRRSQIRTSIDNGTQSLTARDATRALRCLERAQDAIRVNPHQRFGAAERLELEPLLKKAQKELRRQKDVREHHNRMVGLLEQSPTVAKNMAESVAARASEDCKRALELEHAVDGNDSGDTRDQHGYLCQPERAALLQMLRVCDCWADADRCMVIGPNLDGKGALERYTAALTAANQAASFRPTEGYYRGQLVLGGKALKTLHLSIASAREEIERRDHFCDVILTGETHLQTKRAAASQMAFQDADKIGVHEAEWTEAKRLHSLAVRELELQRTIKGRFLEAVEILEHPGRHKAKIALQKVLAALAVDRDGQQSTNELKALEFMKVMCEQWDLGADCLEKAYGQEPEQCHAAKTHFDASKTARMSAEQLRDTPGYDGPKIELSPSAASALERCIEESKDKIADYTHVGHLKGEVGNIHTNMRLAIRHLEEKLSTSAKLSEKERTELESELRLARDEEERQKKVKEAHQQGIRALCENDPESARKCFEGALKSRARRLC